MKRKVYQKISWNCPFKLFRRNYMTLVIRIGLKKGSCNGQVNNALSHMEVKRYKRIFQVWLLQKYCTVACFSSRTWSPGPH
jgi:hypothetical protein